MTSASLRPMLPGDVDAAAEMILAASWGVRRDWFAFATSQPECHPLVAEADGEIVGTGVGTANGRVGWVGTIFVHPDHRRGGLGRVLTEAVIDRLDGAGCRTLVLVATDMGRPLYEKMGFEVQASYQILEARGMDPASPEAAAAAPAVRVRPYEPRDLEAMAPLDAAATGEDRAHVLRRFAAPASAKVAVTADGTIDGFVIRAPWGGGATVARSTRTAMAILAARQRSAGPEGRVRVGLLSTNDAGLATAEAAGLQPIWSAPRMVRGDPLAWHPEWIWGQFNHAMG